MELLTSSVLLFHKHHKSSFAKAHGSLRSYTIFSAFKEEEEEEEEEM